MDEELVRLQSHFEAFESIIAENRTHRPQIGLLIQEMNREINTVGSKSNSIDITKLVITIKSEIQKNSRADSKHRIKYTPHEGLSIKNEVFIMQFINVGFGNMIAAQRVIALVTRKAHPSNANSGRERRKARH